MLPADPVGRPVESGPLALAESIGDQVLSTHLDVTDEQRLRDAVALAEAEVGPVDHLVDDAGILSFGSIEDLSPADWKRTLDVILTGVWMGVHVTIPSIKRDGGGSIVNVSSTAGMQGDGNISAYVASRWGVEGHQTAALELGPHGIRVNLIHPDRSGRR